MIAFGQLLDKGGANAKLALHIWDNMGRTLTYKRAQKALTYSRAVVSTAAFIIAKDTAAGLTEYGTVGAYSNSGVLALGKAKEAFVKGAGKGATVVASATALIGLGSALELGAVVAEVKAAESACKREVCIKRTLPRYTVKSFFGYKYCSAYCPEGSEPVKKIDIH